MHYSSPHHHREYNKPKTYPHQATVKTINAGQPYYVAGPTWGYEGKSIPVAGTVSESPDCCSYTGKLDSRISMSPSLWVTTTSSRHQFGDAFSRSSLYDDGAIHQSYSDRLAFLTERAAKYYASTGHTKEFKNLLLSKLSLNAIRSAAINTINKRK